MHLIEYILNEVEMKSTNLEIIYSRGPYQIFVAEDNSSVHVRLLPNDAVGMDGEFPYLFYRYPRKNRLTNIRLNPDYTGDTNVTYTYLPGGDRMSRTNDTETIYYLYDRENVIAILDDSGNPIQTFLHGKGVDEPVAMKKGANAYYYVQDGQGSTMALINVADGSVAAAYRYDAWGNVESCAGEIAVENPYLFTGREYDWQTGVYHYRARSYDPHLGRFLQRDPAGMVDGTNMYTYCGNDPVNGRDPGGKAVFPVIFKWRDIALDADPREPGDPDMSGWVESLYEAAVTLGQAYRYCREYAKDKADGKLREEMRLPPDEAINRENYMWKHFYNGFVYDCMFSYRYSNLLLGIHLGAPWTWERYKLM